MKFISWNVNGLRAIIKKGFIEIFEELDADFFSLQETKLQKGQIEFELPGYYAYWNYAEKKGYSGTAIFTKHKPLSVVTGIGKPEHDQEGRVVTLTYPNYHVVNCYTPNSQSELKRLDYRIQWEEDFLVYLKILDSEKPVILCGDLNVAHKNIDLKNWKTNQQSAGFSKEERMKFSVLLDNGFIDTFRYFYPDLVDAYTWWNYRFNARKTNAGWRIDYFCVSDRLQDQLQDAKILKDIVGSDHCPVELTLKDFV